MIDALPLLLGPEGYQINRSLRFRSSASAYLSRTPGSAGDRQKFTISFWMKRGTIGTLDLFTGNNANGFLAAFRSDNTLYLYDAGAGSGGLQLWSARVFRDPSAWYHIVIAVDTTQATDTNRLKVYINGVQETLSGWSVGAGASRYPSLNANFDWNNTNSHEIGYALNYGYFDGYLTEFNNVSGQSLPSGLSNWAEAFGETNPVTGVWQPKKYTGTYGTNGFYLPFSTSADQSVTADYLVVAGGGGGGIAGGGAGAGGVLTGSTSLSTGTSYAVTVGAGGIGTNNYTSTSGGNSVFAGFTAIGGAVGSQSAENGKNGGSGSGAGPGAGGYIGGLGTAGQGNNGGNSATSANFGVGGGGGAGAAGAAGTTSASGAGGIGILSSISGTATYYGGGGGGGGINGTSNGAGGLGGGGTGGVHGGANATAGTPNTGGGGGGGANGGGTTGGNGGSGVVIISYAGAARFSGGTITTSGGNTIHTFTSSGALTSLFNDFSGNNNNWTGNNFNVTNTAAVTYDSMLDVPTQWADGGNGRANYCTGNPLIMYNGGGGAAIVPKNGNLDLIGGAGWAMVGSTIAVSTGKWYWEATFYKPGSGDGVLGIHKTNTSLFQIVGYSGDPNGYGYSAGGTKLNNSTGAAYGASYTNGDVIGVALDLDAGTLTFYKNNTSQGVAFSSLSGEFFPAFSSETAYFQANFGQRPFAYTPPTGFKALNTLNLPTPTILKGNQYFDATTYSGQNTSLSVTNSGNMQPDLVWIKKRNGATDHNLTDAVRGANRNLVSNSTAAEDTVARLTSFNSNGFTLAGAFDNTNISGSTYVGWQWKEGPTQGFDIVTYTGDGVANRTVAHSLGVTPAMIIVKARNSSTYAWNSWHRSLSSGYYIPLNTTSAQDNSVSIFPAGGVTSTNWNTGGAPIYNNGSGVNYVAYVFSEVAGFSKFGSYTGNGSADGPFVFCGFRPRFILIKSTTAARDWLLYDTARGTYNVLPEGPLQTNTSGTPYTGNYLNLDILSNGFKVRDTVTNLNANGETHIFAAFAESPFKNALAR